MIKHETPTPSEQVNPCRVLVLHRFDNGEVESFVTRLLIPEISSHAICFRIRNAGNIPGEPGYWLHLFQLLSGLVDAVISVEFGSESYSESIFFEQVLIPKLLKGENVRRKIFETYSNSEELVERMSRVPVLTLSIVDCPYGEYFVWKDHNRRHGIIDVRDATATELLSRLRGHTSAFITEVEELRQSYIRAALEVARDEERIFWGLLRQPLLASAISIDASTNAADWLRCRALLDDLAQQMADTTARELLHDQGALAYWAQMAEKVSVGSVQRTAADKIAAVQAKRWQWIVEGGRPSRLRAAIYETVWKLAARHKIRRYRRLVQTRD